MRTIAIAVAATALAGTMAGQQTGAENAGAGVPLHLTPSPSLAELRDSLPAASKKLANPESGIRPAILNLKPPGDPIYLVPETPPEDGSGFDRWRTYRRPKVDPVSRNGEGLAIQGYDAVAYQDRRAEKGRPEFSVEYGGVRWLFSTADNRDAFQKSPETYLPEYGGFCAYSVGRGYPATADPRAFAVVGRKVYLFFDKAVQAVWEQDSGRMVAAADRAWPQLHR